MLERPGMKVKIFLDIQRKMGDTSLSSEIVRGFTNRFRTSQWPSERPFPEIFYDPRSLSLEPEARAALHAKCIVVDEAEVFVSSANFTEAAQGQNIGGGLSLRSAVIANRITRFFRLLIEHGRFQRVLWRRFRKLVLTSSRPF
jgi:phosphatidylserine/phosphatidylglycerophosphate/cardiolipin synthase-like enzyme